MTNRETYQEQIRRFDAEGKMSPGQAYVIEVLHSRRCALVRGIGQCDCKPTVRTPKRIPRQDEH